MQQVAESNVVSALDQLDEVVSTTSMAESMSATRLFGAYAGLTAMTELCHGLAKHSGWWDEYETIPEQYKLLWVSTKLMLCVSEIVEAFEGARKDLMDDHLPHRKMLEVEIADGFIRMLDLAGGVGLDVAGAAIEKLAYNQRRADHKRENRAAEGGKKV